MKASIFVLATLILSTTAFSQQPAKVILLNPKNITVEPAAYWKAGEDYRAYPELIIAVNSSSQQAPTIFRIRPDWGSEAFPKKVAYVIQDLQTYAKKVISTAISENRMVALDSRQPGIYQISVAGEQQQ